MWGRGDVEGLLGREGPPSRRDRPRETGSRRQAQWEGDPEEPPRPHPALAPRSSHETGRAPHHPSIYLADCLDDFEELVASYPARRRTYRKCGFLTQRGVINNTAFFVRSGIIQLSLGHDKGSMALNLLGPGTVFPVGVETEYLMEQETIIRAFSDVEAYGDAVSHAQAHRRGAW